MSLKLHTDYLSSQSTFLRGLFSGASPLDLINTSPNLNTPNHATAGQFIVPENRLPRLLPAPPSHPILFLPVPDPSSFHLLIHWMYFGRTCFIEDCLDQGAIQWEGIARNVEYLGLPTEIKVYLGRSYTNWLHPARTPCDCGCPDGDFEDSDDEEDEEDDCVSVTSMDEDDERGRTRAARPLSMHRPHST
jgi:hypothetical protein